MKQLRRLAGSSLALVLALGCLFSASPQPRYALAQGSDPGAQPAGRAPAAVGTTFTYQGQLTDGGAPANDQYDFVFELFSVETGGSHMGKLNFEDVTVTDGLFTVQLDFGTGKFTGDPRWLAIFVRPGDSDDPLAFVELSPRQSLTPAPYAIHAGSLDWGQAWTGNGTGLDLTGVAAAPILRATNTYTVTGGGIAGISTASNGVYGETASDNSEKAGVYGVSSDEASGVIGLSTAGDGVVGSGGSGLGDFGGRFTGRTGVYGEGGAGPGGYFTSTSNDALHAEGDVTITGDLAVLGSANIPNYAQTVVVAKSGGDFATIQAAVNSITDATAIKPYLVWVAAGVYSETVTLKPFVHLQGAGQEATIITSSVGSSGLPPAKATLKLSSSTSVRDLSIANTAIQMENIALLVPDGVVDAVVSDVTAWAEGDNFSVYGIYVAGLMGGAGTVVWLENVTARGENGGGTNYCHGMRIDNATVFLRGGSYSGLPLATTFGSQGIVVWGSTSALDAEGVTVLGSGGSDYNFGLVINAGSITLRGGSFTGRGGQTATGINLDYGALTATAVTVLAEEGTGWNYGLEMGGAATATLYGGSFVGRGADYPAGIYATSGTLAAENIACVAELGTGYMYGLALSPQSTTDPLNVTLHGGSFTARDDSAMEVCGINLGSGSGSATLVADHISAVSAGPSDRSYGLQVEDASSTVEVSESVLRGATNSVIRSNGTVTVANARLEGATSGTITCVAVSRGTTFNASGCP